MRSESRRPYWLVGLVLLVVVITALIGAFLLDRQLRLQVGIEPTLDVPIVGRAVSTPTAPPPAIATATTVSTRPAAATSPIASVSPAGLRVATSPLEEEIEDSYYRYWDVLIQACLNLDTSHLQEVMSGAELAGQTQQIRDLKSEGRAAKLDVEHRVAFVQVSPDHAVIYDEYLNRSVFVDPATKHELPTNEPPSTEKISFEMKKDNSGWKVVDGTRHD